MLPAPRANASVIRVKRYPSQYAGPDTGPGRALKLLEEAAPQPGLVVDVGCGRAPLAERIEALGLTYVGIDVNADALAEVESRGYEAHRVDLGGSRAKLAEDLGQALGDRTVSTILAIDLLEHLIEPANLLEALRGLQSDDSTSLVVSVPNVTHFDVAAKLLMGRWDLTEFGLLDDTHLRFFSQQVFEELFHATGWREAAREDLITPISDQLFPADAPFLHPGTPAREVLHRLSSRAHPSFATYQFVRRFEPGEIPAEGHSWAVDAQPAQYQPFASVIVHLADEDGEVTQGILADLDAQSSRNFEVILLRRPGADPAPEHPGVRAIQADTSEAWSTGLANARGRYACLADQSVRISSRWIEAFEAAEPKGHVLAAEAAAVAPRRLASGSADDLAATGKTFPLSPIDLLHPNRPKPTILSAYAIPLAAVRTAGLRFEPRHAEAATAVFLNRAVELCGIVPVPSRTVVVSRDMRHEAEADLDSVASALDDGPLVLPPGSASRLVELQRFKWRRTLPSRAFKRLFARRQART